MPGVFEALALGETLSFFALFLFASVVFASLTALFRDCDASTLIHPFAREILASAALADGAARRLYHFHAFAACPRSREPPGSLRRLAT